MAIDKELFYATHGLKYPVVATPYTDDMIVKEKLYTKDEVVAMLEELNLEIDEMFAREINYTVDKIQYLIQEKINALKENNYV